ncbi:MAG TPA: protein translocase subunit SecF, partial [Actinomycetales bacterium]
MTGRDPRPDADELPVGTDADESAVADAATEDAAAAADDTALADAGLPRQGETGTRRPAHRASLAHRLYNGEAGLDVVGRSRLIYRVTAVVLLLCIAAMVFRGFNFGIDFAGGNSLRLPGSTAQLEQVQEAAEDAGAEIASAQVVGGNTLLLRTGALDNDTERAVVDAVAAAAAVDPSQVSPESVSPEWGQDITRQALVALAVFLVAVVAFLAVRFQPKMAVGAIAALLHDIVVTAGVYALIGFEVTPSTVIGFLTILGFSLYDTVVVFDKVDENVKDLDKSARMTWGEAANLAVNQTLMRSINTSVIAL